MNALPELIAKLPEIITKLTITLFNLMPQIVSAGIRIIVALISGIIGYTPKLIAKIPEIIKGITDSFKKGAQKFLDIGKNLVQGIWKGISNSFSWIKTKISGWVGNVLDFIKRLFGIHSPSRLFRDEIGINLGLGLGEGFEDSLGGVYKDMQRAVDYQNAKLTSNLTTSNQIRFMNEDNRQATLNSIDNNREINVNSTIELDGKVVANTVNKVNAKQRLQYGLA